MRASTNDTALKDVKSFAQFYPTHSEFASIKQWVGENFDSQVFNLVQVNKSPSAIKLKRPSDKNLAAAHKKIERLFE
jgi:hypothetical protein